MGVSAATKADAGKHTNAALCQSIQNSDRTLLMSRQESLQGRFRECLALGWRCCPSDPYGLLVLSQCENSGANTNSLSVALFWDLRCGLSLRSLRLKRFCLRASWTIRKTLTLCPVTLSEGRQSRAQSKDPMSSKPTPRPNRRSYQSTRLRPSVLCALCGLSLRSLRLKAFPLRLRALLATRPAYLLDKRTTLKFPASPFERPALSSTRDRTPNLFRS